MAKKYDFKVHINPYKPEIGKYDLQHIDVSGITIVTKNARVGMLGFATCVKKVWGRFDRVGGSNRYPELIPYPRGVTIVVKGFPSSPRLFKHDRVEDGTITLSDILVREA